MWKRVVVVVAIAMLIAPMAFADRTEDLQKEYADLVGQRIKINEELLRIEGAFREIQRMNAEVKARAEAEAKALDAIEIVPEAEDTE